jgi:hypothetical protein
MVRHTGGSSKLGGGTKEKDLKDIGKERFSHRLIDTKNIEDEPKKVPFNKKLKA